VSPIKSMPGVHHQCSQDPCPPRPSALYSPFFKPPCVHQPCAGFYFLRGALDARSQALWACRCLRDFSRLPHTNLTNLYGSEDGGGERWREAVQTRDLQAVRKIRWVNLGE
jgi:hypothetical protein